MILIKKHSLNKGFSLVETLVAITILLIAVTGPLTVAHRSLFAANTVKNQTTATFLAQDAIEYLRNIRDENNIKNIAWDSGISVCSGTCNVDSVAKTIDVCGVNCPVLRYDSTSGIYGYDAGWSATQFTRTVTLTTLASGEISLLVDVSWTGRLQNSISVVENLLNWNGQD